MRAYLTLGSLAMIVLTGLLLTTMIATGLRSPGSGGGEGRVNQQARIGGLSATA